MKTNRFDGVTKELEKRVLSITGKMAEDYKNTAPLGYEERPLVDRVYIFDQLTQDERLILYQKYGNAYTSWVNDVQKFKNKRGVSQDLSSYIQGVNNGI